MATQIQTRVYIVWASHKGGKWLEAVCFTKERAELTAKAWKEANPTWNFRVEEKATEDCLVWEE